MAEGGLSGVVFFVGGGGLLVEQLGVGGGGGGGGGGGASLQGIKLSHLLRGDREGEPCPPLG